MGSPAPEGDAAARLRARDRVRERRDVHAARPVRVPADARRARPASRRRRAARGAVRAARRARARARRRRRHRVRGLGAERALGLGRRRLQQLGRPPAPDALARLERDLGALRAGRRGRRDVQVRGPHAGRALRLKADPVAFAAEVPPANSSVVYRSTHEWTDDEWLAAARDGRPAALADLDLRGASRLLAPQPARRQPLARTTSSSPTSSATTCRISASRTSS